MIGIELADHTLFPVFPDEIPGRKRLVLTSAQSGLDRARIPLYRFSSVEEGPPELIGTMELDGLPVGRAGTREFRFEAEIDREGDLSTEIYDEDAGRRTERFFPGVVNDIEHRTLLAGALIEEKPSSSDAEKQKNRKTWILVIPMILLVLSIIGFFALSGLRSDLVVMGSENVEIDSSTADAPEAESQGGTPVEVAPPVVENRPSQYHIIWGDTLWDISILYYGTPWFYPYLADENRISNPDLIFADDYLLIPDQPQ